MECSPSSVARWREVVRKSGMEGLAAKRHPGPCPRLSEKQREKLVKLLLKGPQAHGYRNDLWTLPRVAQVIENHFGVRYHPAHVWKILHALGWSCQKPERRAKERDEKKIEQAVEENPEPTWGVTDQAQAMNASIAFFLLSQPDKAFHWLEKTAHVFVNSHNPRLFDILDSLEVLAPFRGDRCYDDARKAYASKWDNPTDVIAT